MELVIAAQLNGQGAWLDSFVAKDAASKALLCRKRAIVISALRARSEIDQLHWPEGEKTSLWQALKEQMALWTNRRVLAKDGWRTFWASESADEAFAAWHVFLSCADRRAHVWMKKIAQAADREATELGRLRSLQHALNRDLLNRALK